MRSLTRFGKGLCAAALALVGLSACDPGYAIYKVQVYSASPRDDINQCSMTICLGEPCVPRDPSAKNNILDDLPLEREYGPTDSSGNPTLRQGCDGGLTKGNVGLFSYSTSRKSGSLTFVVTGWGGPDGQTVIQQGKGQADVKPYPPEIGVDVSMTRQVP